MSNDNILLHTNISILILRKLDNFFSKQTIQIKNDIFSEKRNAFFKLRNEHPSGDFSALELAAFYISINIFYDLKEKAIRKNKTMSTQDIKKYESYVIKSSFGSKKTSQKENFLLDKSSIISSLISENISYREMSLLIKNRYKINISHTYIRRIVEKHPSVFRKNEEK